MSFAKSLPAGLLLTGILTIAPNASFARAAAGDGSHFIDLTIDTYSLPANALVTAETRARKYWAKHQKEIGRDTRYLALQSHAIFSDEIPELYAKLLYTPGINSSDLEDFSNQLGRGWTR